MADGLHWTRRREAIENAAIGAGVVFGLGFVFAQLIGRTPQGGPVGSGEGPTPLPRVTSLGRVQTTPFAPDALVPGAYDLPPGTVSPPRPGSGFNPANAPSVSTPGRVTPLTPARVSITGGELVTDVTQHGGFGLGGPVGGMDCAGLYQTRPRDTLHGIARRFYADDPTSGNYYGAIIYLVNAQAIEAAATAAGLESSGRGQRLATGLWLCLPKLQQLQGTN